MNILNTPEYKRCKDSLREEIKGTAGIYLAAEVQISLRRPADLQAAPKPGYLQEFVFPLRPGSPMEPSGPGTKPRLCAGMVRFWERCGIGACPQLSLRRVVGEEKVTPKEKWALWSCVFPPDNRPGTACQTEGTVLSRGSTQGADFFTNMGEVPWRLLYIWVGISLQFTGNNLSTWPYS